MQRRRGQGGATMVPWLGLMYFHSLRLKLLRQWRAVLVRMMMPWATHMRRRQLLGRGGCRRKLVSRRRALLCGLERCHWRGRRPGCQPWCLR